MLKHFLILFFEFFKTGLFAVGGGLATIPFLYEMMEKYHWFTESELMNMIAISEATPGPMGVNMATYVGYEATGGHLLGGVVTTLALVTPSVIIICVIAQALQTFKNAKWIQDAFYGLRPAVAGMIAAAGLGVFVTVVLPEGWIADAGMMSISWVHVLLFVIFLAISMYYKKLHPIAMICLCAITGIVLQL